MIKSLNSKILQQHSLSGIVRIHHILLPFLSFEKLFLFSSKRAEAGRRLGTLEGRGPLRRGGLREVKWLF